MKKETKKPNESYSAPEVVVHELDDDVFQFVVGGCTDDGCSSPPPPTNMNCGCSEIAV